MKNNNAISYTLEEEINRFAENLTRHPEQADALKSALREKITQGNVHRIARKAAIMDANEPDDLWDNVPV